MQTGFNLKFLLGLFEKVPGLMEGLGSVDAAQFYVNNQWRVQEGLSRKFNVRLKITFNFFYINIGFMKVFCIFFIPKSIIYTQIYS